MNDPSIQQASELFKALGSPTRIGILRLLGEGPLCVGALAVRLGVTPAAISQHLVMLRRAGLVLSDRRGTFIHYRLAEGIRELVWQNFNEAIRPDNQAQSQRPGRRDNRE